MAALSGYKIYRRLDESNDFELIATVPASTNVYHDTHRPYGVMHEYRITAFSESYTSPYSESVTITPGPTYTWIADPHMGAVLRLTHDAQYILMSSYLLSYPWKIEVNPRTGNAWVVDALFGNLIELSSSGELLNNIDGLSNISDIALDVRLNVLWLADEAQGILYRLSGDGTILSSSSGHVRPSALSVRAVSGECYLSDTGSCAVSVFNRYGDESGVVEFEFVYPRDISVDNSADCLWIADRTQVVRYAIDADTVAVFSDNFVSAARVAPNERTGQCWVLDEGERLDAGRLLLLDAEGNIIMEKGGFMQPFALSVNFFDNSCTVAELGAGVLSRISAEGEIEELPVAVVAPYDVEVENH